MVKSILIAALRNIFRNRTFSLINLVGLSVAMSVALLIITVIREQFTFDTFHADTDRIYRVNTNALRKEGGEEPYASVPFPLGQAIAANYTFAEEVVRLNRQLNADATAGNVTIPIRGLLTDASLLSVFNFPLAKGDPKSALASPSSLVLTHDTAIRLFGQADPMGRTVSMGSLGEFQVSGVLMPFPGRTHFEFDALASTERLALMEKQRIIDAATDNWNNYYGSYIYLKLKPGVNLQDVDASLSKISKDAYANLPLESRDKGYGFFLISLEEITPGPMMSNQMGSGMPMLLVIFLGVVAGLIMLMACFNYTNLMIAKSMSRTREIGVRKVIGARRRQVFFQFIGEAVVFSLLALVSSYGILQLLKPAFRELNIAREFAVTLGESWGLYGWFFLFAVGTGALAGFLPSVYLSALKPAAILKDNRNPLGVSRQMLRKSLIVAQFTLSIGFIIVIHVIFNQVNFMLQQDYGFREENILNVRLQGLAFDKLATEVERLPGVVSVGGVSHRLGTWQDRSSDYQKEQGAEPFGMRDFMVDRNYIDQLGLQFVAGRNFDENAVQVREKYIILNERALDRFGFPSAVEALGQPIYLNDSTSLAVIGVVKDFHFRPMNYEIGPLALRSDPREFGYLSIKIAPGHRDEVVARLEPVWKRLDPVHTLEWKMMSDEIDEAYTDSGFVDVVKIVGYIAFLAVTLACLGMLGMAMYATQMRIKEVGIRKVMGASSVEVVLLLSRAFLILIAVAAVIGTPIGYFFGNLFLDSYAYKSPISIGVLLSGVAVMGLLGTVVIITQTWKAATENPVNALRYE